MTMDTGQRTRRWGLAAWGVIASLCGPIASARAQRCERDEDCPNKFSCQVTGKIDCPNARPCPEGSNCGEPEDCQPSEYRECVSPACEDDADCPADMVCYERTTTRCSGSTPGCPPEGCSEPVDAGAPDCERTTERSCVPRYVPPCEDDEDCGEGFSCEEEIVSMCSGGGSTGTGGAAPELDGGRAGNPPDSNTQCTTMPTGRFHCVLQPIECTDQSECPDRFSCEEDPNRPRCAVTDPDLGPDDPAAGGEEAPCPDAGPASNVCLPPYYDLAGNDRGGQTSSEGGPDASTASPPKTPGTRKESSGCSVAFAGQQHGTLALAALLALLGSLLRARSRRIAARAQPALRAGK